MSDWICPNCKSAVGENEVCSVCAERKASHRTVTTRCKECGTLCYKTSLRKGLCIRCLAAENKKLRAAVTAAKRLITHSDPRPGMQVQWHICLDEWHKACDTLEEDQ